MPTFSEIAFNSYMFPDMVRLRIVKPSQNDRLST